MSIGKIAASLVAVFGLSSIAQADTFYACKFNALGTIRIVGAASICASYETKISWNSTGAQGPKGDKGDTGPPGVAGASCPPGSTTTTTGHYVDCGDGTLVDTNTNLMWEKKDSACATGDAHCVNNLYTWSGVSYSITNIADGTLYIQFLAALNADVVAFPLGTAPTGCFAHHCDWRIPQLSELQTIISPTAAGCNNGFPCIDPAFGPTRAFPYWSSSSYAGNPNAAWFLDFNDANVSSTSKDFQFSARAVRAGR